MHVKTVFSLVVPALAFFGGAAGLPSGQYSDYEPGFRDNDLTSNHTGLTIRPNAKGASIVSGVGSSTGNG
jgi:hypothetical protein